jgi:hypothetical protein
MPRRERLDFKDAIHYVGLRGAEGSEIFFEADRLGRTFYACRQNALHVQSFESLLTATCTECDTALLGYCLEPNSGVLVVRTPGAPLKAFMQRLCGQYSRYLRAGGFVGLNGVFGGRYHSKIVAPDYLPHAVRRAHCSPIVSGLCKHRVDYPFSSERGYMGERFPIPLTLADLRAALELKGHFGSRGYREFMDRDETPYVANLLSHGSPLDARIVGDKVFVQKARHMAAHPAAPPTREQLIGDVARLMRKAPADILSATHAGALGRALVAWYSVRSGAATLTAVGRWFSVSAATLGQGIRHHRNARPELFSLCLSEGSRTQANSV